MLGGESSSLSLWVVSLGYAGPNIGLSMKGAAKNLPTGPEGRGQGILPSPAVASPIYTLVCTSRAGDQHVVLVLQGYLINQSIIATIM